MGLFQKCQAQGCRPYPASKTVQVRLRSGIIAVVHLCDMHKELHDADTRKDKHA